MGEHLQMQTEQLSGLYMKETTHGAVIVHASADCITSLSWR